MEVPSMQFPKGSNSMSSAPQGKSLSAAAGLRQCNPYRERKRIVLCFDGTGNKFSGMDSDSNILKIYGMLDRTNGDKHYYQPGIGTYVNTRSLSHTSKLARLNSWYQKAKDSAVGSSFDEHVMGAYKFLMQCYNDDDIYFFGFSRGAYVARFLAEMLDHVGLLSQGNQEMARFAWKAFAQWQEREENTDEEKVQKKEMLDFLQAFRDTFSRPVRRVRFLGLFDTVNSVPRFENAWMQRSKFPYTARSSAKVIRHAVSIDERRAKFRSDLISEAKTARPSENAQRGRETGDKDAHSNVHHKHQVDRFRRTSRVLPRMDPKRSPSPRFRVSQAGTLDSRGTPCGKSDVDGSSLDSDNSSFMRPQFNDDSEEDEAAPQDIEELWFPGGHADLGGGWPLANGEEFPLSHGPLVWMVREAQRAGLEFDSQKMLALKCCDDTFNMTPPPTAPNRPAMPEIQVTSTSNADVINSSKTEEPETGWTPGLQPPPPQKSVFHQNLETAATKGVLHDCLELNNGVTFGGVLSWRIMEYMPFRRMDLRPDGSWKAINFPLPMGETRDIPENAWIHHSAIKRMEADERYRPGNLIIGGGGRGVRRAPKKFGMGEWEVLKGKEDPVGMVYVRKGPSLERKVDWKREKEVEERRNGKAIS